MSAICCGVVAKSKAQKDWGMSTSAPLLTSTGGCVKIGAALPKNGYVYLQVETLHFSAYRCEKETVTLKTKKVKILQNCRTNTIWQVLHWSGTSVILTVERRCTDVRPRWVWRSGGLWSSSSAVVGEEPCPGGRAGRCEARPATLQTQGV